MEKTYTESLIVNATDCDPARRMRLDALFVAMQEGGGRHAQTLGVGYGAMHERGLFFALTRIHVRVRRAPRCGERVVHTTWPGVANRFFCPRYHVFSLEDGTPLAAAGALWVILDEQKRSIVSPLKADLRFPDNSDLPEPIQANVRLPALGADARALTRSPVYSEFDINGHVNNTKYIAWLCDALGKDTLSEAFIGELVAGYEKEIRDESPKSLLLSREGDAFAFRILSPGGEKHFAAGGTLCKEVG